MGGEPPKRPNAEDEELRHQAGARGHWFARILGEEWVADADGIYRFVGRDAAGRPGAEPEPVEELGDALAPSRQADRVEQDVEAHALLRGLRRRRK